MHTLELELIDGEGDKLFVCCRSDGTLDFEWWSRPKVWRDVDFKRFNRLDWEGSSIRGHLIPLIEAAFAALKEEADAQDRA